LTWSEDIDYAMLLMRWAFIYENSNFYFYFKGERPCKQKNISWRWCHLFFARKKWRIWPVLLHGCFSNLFYFFYSMSNCSCIGCKTWIYRNCLFIYLFWIQIWFLLLINNPSRWELDNSHRHLIESLDLSDDNEVISFLRYVKILPIIFSAAFKLFILWGDVWRWQ
jgi:hypothetical protein